jgi:hypothetical protein
MNYASTTHRVKKKILNTGEIKKDSLVKPDPNQTRLRSFALCVLLDKALVALGCYWPSSPPLALEQVIPPICFWPLMLLLHPDTQLSAVMSDEQMENIRNKLRRRRSKRKWRWRGGAPSSNRLECFDLPILLIQQRHEKGGTIVRPKHIASPEKGNKCNQNEFP